MKTGIDMDTVQTGIVAQARSRVAEIGRMMFDRNLTDSAGGNISVRVGDVVCMSPTQSGHKRQWQINPEDVLVTDLEGNIIEGEGGISRESNVHYLLHHTFGEYGTAVIHAHPRNLMVFAAMAKTMPPVLEANVKFGDAPCIEYAPAHSIELSKNVKLGLEGMGCF
jgi:L-fuculose-phosphate aldolase